MSFRVFLKLAEIQTKIASVFPFLIGVLFVTYRYQSFDWRNTLIFFVALLLFDLTTTVINNYMDYKKASSEQYRREHNIIRQESIPLPLVRLTIMTMLIISTGLGIWLVYRTDLLVLFIGMLSFAIGIFYTFGPIPLSRMPLGEVFSGVTMGFGIIFLTIYINAYTEGIANLSFGAGIAQLNVNLLLLLEIVLVSLPSVLTISNLMLANNICDLEEDIKNHRFTLPYYIGKKNAVYLFNLLYILVILSVIVAVALDIYPVVLLGIVLIISLLFKNIKTFNKEQIKHKTFSVAVKNLVLINGAIVVLLSIALLWM